MKSENETTVTLSHPLPFVAKATTRGARQSPLPATASPLRDLGRRVRREEGEGRGSHLSHQVAWLAGEALHGHLSLAGTSTDEQSSPRHVTNLCSD